MLPATAKNFGYTDDFLQEAADQAEREVYEASDVLTIGDFWTGNILVSDNSSKELQLFVLDLELSKPGTAAFDIGQMAAEMYCLGLFRDEELGMALLDTFLKAYKAENQNVVNATKVAIRVGAHLIIMMPKAWANEGSEIQIQDGVRTGIELVRMGWQKDVAALSASLVAPLL